MTDNTIELFTDGSCHTGLKAGAWAAILLYDGKKIILKGTVRDTTHNAMEMWAVIQGLEYLKSEHFETHPVVVYSDSQYVVNIPLRRDKLIKSGFLTKSGSFIKNCSLVQSLIYSMESYPITIIKVRAHRKSHKEINYNREVDMTVRKLLRETIRKNTMV